MLAARVPTRHRSWRRVKPRAAADAGKMVGSAQLLPLFSAGGAVTCKTKKKNTNHNNKPPLFISVFFSSASYRSGFLDFVSTLFQVAGKEEDTDQRGVTAGGVRSDCGYCCCRWGLFGRW
jgi:hypothetical protein